MLPRLRVKGAPDFYGHLLFMFLISKCLTFAEPLLAPILTEFAGMGPQEASATMAIAFLGAGLLQPIVGTALDRGRFGIVLGLSALGVTAGIAALLFAFENPFWLIVGVIALLFGLSSDSTAYNRFLVGQIKKGEPRKEAAANFYWVNNIGMAIASLSAYLFLREHREVLLLGDWITTIAAIGVAYLFSRRFSKQLRVAALERAKKPKVPFFRKAKLAFRNWRVLLALLLVGLEVFAHNTVVPLIYSERGLDSIKLSTLATLANTILVVLTTAGLSRFFSRYHEGLVLFAGMAFYSVGHMLVPYFLTTPGVIFTTLIWTLGEITIVPVTAALVYRCYDEKDIGLAAGVQIALRSTSLFLTPLVGYIIFMFFDHAYRESYSLFFGVVPFLAFLLVPKRMLYPAGSDS